MSSENWLSFDGFTPARIITAVILAIGSGYSFYNDVPFPGILLAGASAATVYGGGFKS